MIRTALTCAAVAICFPALAVEAGFTYNSSGMDPYGFGYTKSQVYDVGVAIGSPALTGRQILGFSVPVFDSEYVGEVKAWLSAELSVSKLSSEFTPDIACYDAAVSDGVLTFSFPEPYVIPESGVYVGYSFAVSDVPESAGSLPVAVVDGNTSGGLWLHAAISQKKWADLAARNNIVSAMTVTVAGDLPGDAVAFSIAGDHIYAAKEESSTVVVNIVNQGVNGISSFDYSYSVAGIDKSGYCELPSPLPGVLGMGCEVEIGIDPIAALGDYDLEFEVTAVNGNKDVGAENKAVSLFTVQPFVAVYRPLIEEYTGRACGWCPRGYVMFEQMNLYHGDQFVGLAYHNYNNDGMTCVEDLPFSASGAPTCFLNRGNGVDPDRIPDMWMKVRDSNTPADVKVDLEWTDDSRTCLKATASARFLYDMPDNNYLFSIALLADRLSDEKWGQSNGYADFDMSPAYNSPYWDLFIGKGNPVMGLEYNDVVVYYKEISGVDGSLPESVVADTWYEFTYYIPVDDVKTVDGKDVVSDFDKTRAVAIVLDGSTGKPLNSASSLYPDGTHHEPLPSSVSELKPEVSSLWVRYIDLQGREMRSPSGGIFIRLEGFSDGSVKSSKVVK